MTAKNIFLFLVLFSVFQIGFSQRYSTKSKRAVKYFEKALEYYKYSKYEKALPEAEKAIKKDPNFVEVYYLISDIYSAQRRYEEKIDILKKAVSISPENNKFAYLNLCKTELHTGKYKDALNNLFEFEKRNSENKYMSEINKLKKICMFRVNAVENPVDFNPKNLGNAINTELDEYSPALTVDEKSLIFTAGVSRKIINGISNRGDIHEDFFISNKSDSGSWLKAQNMKEPVNTPGNEGAQSISADGRVLFFASCENFYKKNLHGKSYGSCDIFYSVKTENGWSKPENLGEPINSKSWESQPSFSSDGKTLYFVSNRKGGKGGTDLWKSVKQKNGKWSEPENLGKNINTKGDEQSPFIHPDNKTLYFSSNGHLGMGKSDLFVVRKNEKGNWKIPENLGYPINTHEDQFSLIVNAKGNIAYFSSVYSDGYGGLDIYSFDLPEKNKPKSVSFVKGIVYDSETKNKLKADFELINMSDGKIFTESSSDKKTGEFLLCLPLEKDYVLNVSKNGYLFFSENFTLRNIKNSANNFFIEVPLKPIKKGKTIVLKNILFEIDSYELKKESYIELEKLLNFLKNNRNLTTEIGGHTDNTGTEKHNKELSNNRAKTVCKYLIANGIDKNRISYKGYGSEVPISDNNTKKGKAENRRTELKIIK